MDHHDPIAPTASRWQHLALRARVLEALAVRDMMRRYGRGNLGFLWVLLEPMILTVGVMLIWSIMKGESEHGVDIIALVLTGYMPLTLWRHVTNSGVALLRSNSSVLYHRNISLLDVFMGRMLLEFVGTSAALVVVAGSLLALGLIKPPQDYSMAVVGWLLMATLSVAAALLLCVLTELSEVWERFVQPFQYLMLPASGAFFMVGWLPTDGQKWILLNPTVHCFEAFRAGYLGDQYETHYMVWYPIACSIFLFAVGMKVLPIAADRLRLD